MAMDMGILDQLPAGPDRREVLGRDGLVGEVRKALSERIARAVREEVAEWQSRPLDPCAPPVFSDPQ